MREKNKDIVGSFIHKNEPWYYHIYTRFGCRFDPYWVCFKPGKLEDDNGLTSHNYLACDDPFFEKIIDYKELSKAEHLELALHNRTLCPIVISFLQNYKEAKYNTPAIELNPSVIHFTYS